MSYRLKGWKSRVLDPLHRDKEAVREGQGQIQLRTHNGLFQEEAKLGPVERVTEKAGVWGAQPAL